jgi:hypothetical protein
MYFWGVFAPELFIIWGIMLDAFYNKRARVHAFLISICIALVAYSEVIVEMNLPQGYFIIYGIIRVIILISLAIILVKISIRSMEKATQRS